MDLIIIFLAGIFTSLGPCVISVLPVVFTYTFGITNNKKEALLVSTCFVLGFSIVFSLLGALSAYIGGLFTLYNLRHIAGIIAIFFGISILFKKGILFRSKENKFSNIITKLNNNLLYRYKLLASFVFGMSYSFGANICADPILAGILTYTAVKGDVLFGFFALFIYSIGYGIPIILLSILGIEGKKLIEKIANLKITNIISGLLLIILGIYLLIY